MLTATEIQFIIENGEGFNTEFKVAVPSKVRDITEEICAFANAAGGTLLIGINDNNQIVGADIDNNKRSSIQNSISEISPALHCSLSTVTIAGKKISVIEVPSGPDKPYIFSGAIYVRIGPNSQKLTTAEQMRDFFQQADKIHFDEVPRKNFDIQNEVDPAMLSEFKHAAGITQAVPDQQLYSNLQMLSENGFFKNGSVLFFGKQPQKYFSEAIIRCVAFRGDNKRFISDDKTYTGPLYHQFLGAMEWLRGKLNVGYDIEGQGAGPRKEIWEIPENALKEALLNAIAHRDYYDKGATTTIELFDNRVEITNPGGLVSAIHKTEFGTKSHSRNPLIFGLFTRMQMVEKIGSGIRRMKELMSEAKLAQPEFKTEGMFTVIFERPEKNTGNTTNIKNITNAVEETVEETVEEKILKLIKENPKATAQDMTKTTGLTRRGVEYNLNKLKAAEKITRIGSTKAGYWQIND